ncbi:nitroreductase family protein [Tomitella fengzijianii]|uniref:Nitroreductase family protein n=1 Tax=Tomitella fengzijianii TaxID=2597660 RepID=A0A516WYZ0_9ACTN|nr:nitroreductase family protein [Tomitella fengzijianii]QDQ96043.1 nitroreductase family protein [Tomitella fengzijianii]
MDVIEAMRTTGTCRYYRDEPVPEEVLYAAFEAARFAPQGGNRQPVRWIAVRDRALKATLGDAYLRLWREEFGPSDTRLPESDRRRRALEPSRHHAEHFADAPVILVLCAREAALKVTDADLRRTSVVGGASIYPTMQNLCLALRDAGVATTVTTMLCREESAVRELLGIPDEYLTAAYVCAGYPARPFPTNLRRRPVEEFVFADRFGEPLYG